MRSVDEMKESNRRRWDEKAMANWSSSYYDVPRFLRERNSLLPVELREVGTVEGKDLLHLQCHFGMDSLSWAARGARVTGVDFSSQAISRAKDLSDRTGIPARFIQSDVYGVDEALSDKFDIVFTSYGVLCWLPDLDGWARQISLRLRPGGFFYIVEGHPFGDIMDETRPDRFQTGYPYFGDRPIRFDDDHLMDEGYKFSNKERFEWFHPLSSIINSLIKHGLRLEFLHEYPFSFFPMHPSMKKGEDGYWRFETEGFNAPFLFSIKAVKE